MLNRARRLRGVIWAIEKCAKYRLRGPDWSHPAVTKRPRHKPPRKADPAEVAKVDQILPRLEELRTELTGLIAGEYEWLDLDAIDAELSQVATSFGLIRINVGD